MIRLLDAAKRRPLEDARTVRRGKNKGQQVIKLSAPRAARLKKLGRERALIYKMAILTGLRLNELRTLTVGNLSFAGVPHLRLYASNEKNRKGSTVPLRSDLAEELKEWTKGKSGASKVFLVPAGLLRIMNRDLELAAIPKKDSDGTIIHIHALRHSFGTHLSKAGVQPRVAQGLMRHSKIDLTMNVYTDGRLLDSAGAVESICLLRNCSVTTDVTTDSVQTCPIESLSVTPEAIDTNPRKRENLRKIIALPEVFKSGRYRTRICDLNDVNVAL